MRKKFNIEGLPEAAPEMRIREIGAFWPHFHLHRRVCASTKKNIISVYSDECPYPVFHKDEWMKNVEAPGADFVPGEKVFSQMWQFFSKSPIPHNTGVENENCEFTDDWWYSRNCYLSHSGHSCEDVSYCYRARNTNESMFVSFVFDCELAYDVVNSRNCFNVIHALNCRQVHDSAFLYDCRNCSNCLFCFNLRNKEYCIGNQQLTKAEYLEQRKQWNFTNRESYETAKGHFDQMMKTMAWHRGLSMDRCENSSGNFLENAKSCENCFFINGSEDCINCVRSVSGDDKTCLDSLGHFGGELLYYSVLPQDNCYDVKMSFNVIQSQFLEYCANCFQCKHCFGCSGLKGKEYHIFNKPYSPEEYETLKAEIIAEMKTQGEYGKFFPSFFAPVPYEESWSAVHFPLSLEE